MILKKPDADKPVFDIYPDARSSILRNECPMCGMPITSFRNIQSEREYSISGLCQMCQDKIFDK